MPASVSKSLFRRRRQGTYRRRLIRPYDFIFRGKMQLYSSLGKQSYSGVSLGSKLYVDWIDDRYRVPLKSPVYGNIPQEYANVKMFKAKYF